LNKIGFVWNEVIGARPIAYRAATPHNAKKKATKLLKADFGTQPRNFCFVPKADIQ
jgi:hypothetical protein